MSFHIRLLSIFALLLTGCHSVRKFPRTGGHKYCLVDYEHHLVDCSYDSMAACRERYQNDTAKICFPKAAITNEVINAIEERN